LQEETEHLLLSKKEGKASTKKSLPKEAP